MQFISLIIYNTNLRGFTLFLVLCNCFVMMSQNLVNEVEGYQWFDSIVDAKNTNLFNGVIEVEKFRMTNEKHKFYKSQNFLSGTLFYDGQPYYSVQLKYNLYEDVVLINGGNTIRLENDKINRFFIEDKAFVKIKPSRVGDLNMNGFFEILINTPTLKLYKKHKKIKLDRLGNKLIYNDFSDDNRYFLFHHEKIHRIKTKRDVTRIFPMYKNQLNHYSIKSSGVNTKEDFLLFLLNRVNELLTEETP